MRTTELACEIDLLLYSYRKPHHRHVADVGNKCIRVYIHVTHGYNWL